MQVQILGLDCNDYIIRFEYGTAFLSSATTVAGKVRHDQRKLICTFEENPWKKGQVTLVYAI